MHAGMCTIVQNTDEHADDRDIYAGMTRTDAERDLRCFASEVMPRLRSKAITGNIAWAA